MKAIYEFLLKLSEGIGNGAEASAGIVRGTGEYEQPRLEITVYWPAKPKGPTHPYRIAILPSILNSEMLDNRIIQEIAYRARTEYERLERGN
jgi:hypothetical protein